MTFTALCRSFAAAAGLMLAVSAHAVVSSPYSALYVFGDSLSDSGNAYLSPFNVPVTSIPGNSYVLTGTYNTGAPGLQTFSNGPAWSTQFAQLLGVSLLPSGLGGTNYAIGGATTGSGSTSLKNQVGDPTLVPQSPFGSALSVANTSLPSSALYVVAGGGNNGRAALQSILGGADPAATNAAAASSYASDVLGMVTALKGAGAQNIIVWNTPNLGLTPMGISANAINPLASTYASTTALAMNSALSAALAGQAGVQIFDTYAFLTNTVVGVLSTPGGYNGITNALNACGAVGNCGSSLFLDGIHPTTYAHSLLAQQMFAMAVPVPEPAEYLLLLAGLAVVAGVARRRAHA